MKEYFMKSIISSKGFFSVTFLTTIIFLIKILRIHPDVGSIGGSLLIWLAGLLVGYLILILWVMWMIKPQAKDSKFASFCVLKDDYLESGGLFLHDDHLIFKSKIKGHFLRKSDLEIKMDNSDISEIKIEKGFPLIYDAQITVILNDGDEKKFGIGWHIFWLKAFEQAGINCSMV
jgi:hypothetical protein